MAENGLCEKRERMKGFLSHGSERTLLGMVLEGTGHAVGRVLRRTHGISFWYSAAVISVLILIIGLLTSIVLSEYPAFRWEILRLEILGAFLTYASLVIFKAFTSSFFSSLRENIVDAIISEDSLADLQRWLELLCNVRLNLAFSLVYGLTTGILSISALSAAQGKIGYGPTVTFCLIAFTWGIPMYFLFVFLLLPFRLTRYAYRMFGADPSSSEVIQHLSSLLQGIVYLYAVVAAGSMVYLGFAGVLTSPNDKPSAIAVVSILVAWLPITVLFVTSHYALAKIILGAKRQRLNEIQAQIEQVQATEDITERDTMEKVMRLMDFHDRIKGSKDSLLDVGAILGFLYSLLLPVIGLVLGNLDTLMGVLRLKVP